MAEQPLPPSGQPTSAEVLARDPLTPVTRKERLYVLATSMIGIAMVRTGLVPSKIATFGIELDKPNRSALLFLLALVTIYFLGAFIVYAASDFMAYREAIRVANSRELDSFDVSRGAGMAVVVWLRLLFEFVLPVLVGLYGIYTLLAQAIL